MLLVTGATGTTGMEVLRALKARGAEARALVRDETKAHQLRDLGFAPVTGDLGDPRTLAPALDGVERAYLVAPASPMQMTRRSASSRPHRMASPSAATSPSPIWFRIPPTGIRASSAAACRWARSRCAGRAWTRSQAWSWARGFRRLERCRPMWHRSHSLTRRVVRRRR